LQQVNPYVLGVLPNTGFTAAHLNPSFVQSHQNQGFAAPYGSQTTAQTVNPFVQQCLQNSVCGLNAFTTPTTQLAASTYANPMLSPSLSGFVPAISVIERHDAFVVTCELAGVTDKEIEVYVHQNQVTIRGNRVADTTEQQNPWQIAERHFGPFVRCVTLPIAVIANKVKAELRDGLLVVDLPKITQIEGDIQRVKLNSK
jgi:HSP20 family molecular chaperone IbpA